jgi:hypothetical protein
VWHRLLTIPVVSYSYCRYDTGFKFAALRFHGEIVSLMAADMLLGHERRWHWLSQEGTAAFLNSSNPRMLVLSRMELNGGDGCCSMKSAKDVDNVCHDMFVFRSPLHANVRLDLFNYQQNIWQGENYAVGLLQLGGYELFNPCFDLPLFHNHNSDVRPNQNENRCLHAVTFLWLPSFFSILTAFYAASCQSA